MKNIFQIFILLFAIHFTSGSLISEYLKFGNNELVEILNSWDKKSKTEEERKKEIENDEYAYDLSQVKLVKNVTTSTTTLFNQNWLKPEIEYYTPPPEKV